MSQLDSYLLELLAEASAELPEVSQKRLFGSQALFALGRIYALVWDGRIALKVTDEARYAELLELPGSDTWSPMPDRESKPMSGWVLVSEAMHDDLEALRPWVELAHRLAFSGPAPKKRKPKAPAKKTAPVRKKAAAKKRR